MYSLSYLEQSVVPCPVLTVASWPAYRFLKRQVRCSGIPISKNFPQLVVIHTVKGFGVVSKTEVEIKGIIPFTIAMVRIKYLGINLPKETKSIYIKL